MKKIKLLDNWKFCKGLVSSLKIMEMSGKAPEVVTLPHDAMIYEKRSKETKNGSQTGFYPGGIYTYFKDIDVPIPPPILTPREEQEYIVPSM